MDISQLSEQILQVHKQFQQKAISAVNISLTLLNWFIGYNIVEYEQNGEDRAKYGDKLIRTLSKNFQKLKLKGMSFTNLNIYRKFYLVYPQIIQALPEHFQLAEQKSINIDEEEISQSFTYLIPPMGVLLCTKSKKNMVKYATAANEQLFVSEYRLKLPTEQEIQAYVETKLK